MKIRSIPPALPLAAVLLATLAACGGGGGGSGDTTPYNLDTALRNWYAQGEEASLRGSGACTGTFVQVQRPAEEGATIGGNAARFAGVTQTRFVRPECPLPSSTVAQTEFFDNAFAPLARSAPGEYGVYATPPVLPASARPGDQGVAGSLDLYTDLSRQQALGREELRYALEAGPDAGSAILRLTSHRYDPGNALQATTERRFRVTTDARLSLVSVEFEGIRFAR